MKKIIILVITVLCIIPFVSTMTYEQQSIVPELRVILHDEPFKDFLSKLEFEYWNSTISVETRGYVYFVEFLIRKATHFIGYGVIGIIFYLFYRKLKWRFAPFLAVASVFVLGSIDEYIQYFTPGRTGVFDDVLLDTAGAFTFVLLTTFITFVLEKLKGGRRILR